MTKINRVGVVLAAAAVVLVMPARAWAQHEEHQMGAAPASNAEMAQCVQAQPAVQNIIAAAEARLETARVSNNPTELRAAIAQMDAALRDIRTQLAPCSAASTSADPHAGHTMPMGAAPGAPVDKPGAALASPADKPGAAADPHAGHVMPPAPAAPKPVQPRSK